MLDMIKIGDRHIHYLHRLSDPQKPTLVLINSLGTDLRIWSFVLPKFEREFNVLLFDKRGHGLSETAGTQCLIADYTSDLIALMSALSITRAVPVGLSIGGLIAQELYHQRPDLVEMLVLTNTASKIGTFASWSQRIDAVKHEGLSGIVALVLEKWFAAGFVNSHPDRFAAAKSILSQTTDKGYIAACCALRDADLTENAKSIELPTLCIAGSEDQATPVALVKTMADAIPNSQFTVLQNCGHIPCLEVDQMFCHTVLDFLRDNLKSW